MLNISKFQIGFESIRNQKSYIICKQKKKQVGCWKLEVLVFPHKFICMLPITKETETLKHSRSASSVQNNEYELK